MSDATLTFKLEKAARKNGGDKYACEGREDFSIYIPQDISRAGGKPAGALRVSISDGAEEV